MKGLEAFKSGSSPRVRGTDSRRWGWSLDTRFIPARAGNGRCSLVGPESGPVHPRACGERETQDDDEPEAYGSSPRVRGTVEQVSSTSYLERFIPRVRGTGPDGSQFRVLSRFIPARAGNGRAGRWPLRVCPVHPRACGERCGLTARVGIPVGSSPRVRGTDPTE